MELPACNRFLPDMHKKQYLSSIRSGIIPFRTPPFCLLRSLRELKKKRRKDMKFCSTIRSLKRMTEVSCFWE